MGGSKGGGGKNGIPDRWKAYTNMGRQIPGTRFIAFKVPLKETLLIRLEDSSWFGPRTLMDHCVDLGLVIDLTNTTRYYDPKEFTDHGIQYAKVIPSDAFNTSHLSMNDYAQQYPHCRPLFLGRRERVNVQNKRPEARQGTRRQALKLIMFGTCYGIGVW
ncbi:RNA/RNP complex-1-interacting phosphatase [Penaeus vannamei]|uniref:RNA/RNP complex-1-interacting phosphatase n=1 Tax=Penaeus vannamei TaxID=6689 RepID=A0A423SQZ6_PENVA|nr:RNA/RNP complex-1-interacting phosphatase [Penaeus vannamei]